MLRSTTLAAPVCYRLTVVVLILAYLLVGAAPGEASVIGIGTPVRGGNVAVTVDIGGFFVFNPVAVQVPIIGTETPVQKAAKIKSAVDAALAAAGLPKSTAPTPTSIDTGSANVTDVNAGTTGETDSLVGGTVYGRPSTPLGLIPGFSFLSGVGPAGDPATYVLGFRIVDSKFGSLNLFSALTAPQLFSLSLDGLLEQQFSILNAQLLSQAPALGGDLVLELTTHQLAFNLPSSALSVSVTNGTTDTALESSVKIQPIPEPSSIALYGSGLAAAILTLFARRRVAAADFHSSAATTKQAVKGNHAQTSVRAERATKRRRAGMRGAAWGVMAVFAVLGLTSARCVAAPISPVQLVDEIIMEDQGEDALLLQRLFGPDAASPINLTTSLDPLGSTFSYSTVPSTIYKGLSLTLSASGSFDQSSGVVTVSSAGSLGSASWTTTGRDSFDAATKILNTMRDMFNTGIIVKKIGDVHDLEVLTPRSDGGQDSLGLLALMAARPAADELAGPDAKACADKPTVDIVECLNAQTRQWKQRLNAAYKALLQRIDARQRETLETAQRLWVQYRDANCLFYAAGEGTIRQINAAECLRSIVETRARELDQAARP